MRQLIRRGSHVVTNNAFLGVAKLAVGFAIVSWILWANRDALSSIRADTFSPLWLLTGGVILVVAISISFVRWWGLVRATGLSLRLRDAMLMGYVGYAYNLVLPGAVGGDLVKSVMIARRQSKRTTAVTTIVMDRVIGLLGLVTTTTLIGVVWIIFGDPKENVRSIALFSCLFSPLIIVGLVFLFSKRVSDSRLVSALSVHPRFGSIVTGVMEAIEAYRSNPRAIVTAIGLTLVGQGLLILAVWVLGRAIYPVAAPMASHFLLMPLALSAGAVPLTPGGLGVLDTAVVELYKAAGHEAASAIAVVLGYRLIQVLMSVVGFALYFLFAKGLVDHSIEKNR